MSPMGSAISGAALNGNPQIEQIGGLIRVIFSQHEGQTGLLPGSFNASKQIGQKVG
jgi:hypothetical protein